MIGETLKFLKRNSGIADRCYLAEVDASGRIDKNKMVIFDSVSRESWSAPTNVPNYTVQAGQRGGAGTTVSGDRTALPQTVSITAELTNHTFLDNEYIPGVSALANYLDTDDTITERLELLEKWSRGGVSLAYKGSIKGTSKKLGITSYNPSKTSESGDAVSLSINLQELRDTATSDKYKKDVPGTKDASSGGLASGKSVSVSTKRVL